MATTTHTPSIHLRGVHRTFASPDPEVGEVRAVDGINLDIQPGEIVALLGPNGAGKTTTLDMVLGFTQPTSGQLSVLGREPQEAVLSGLVAAVLQTGGLLRDLTVRETAELVASTHPNPRPVDEVIERAGLTAIQHQQVQSTSGGEQQRLRFALALLGNPELLVLDEPTTGMDVAARHEFWASMRTEAARGRTIVFATHYLQEAEDFAERTVLMANGRIVADGPTDSIRRLATSRRLSARVDDEQIDAAYRSLADLPAVRSITTERGRLIIEASDSDDVALRLLRSLGGTDLEIESASLEHACIQLTSTGGAL